jgi:hypothetical protein
LDLKTISNVVVDRFGERIGLLKDHPNTGPQPAEISAGSIDILLVQIDLTADTGIGDKIVHPVKTP